MAISSAPVLPVSGSEPGDTTLFIATAAPFTSDGPTLPIVGGVDGKPPQNPTAGSATTDPNADDERAAKRRKTDDNDTKKTKIPPTTTKVNPAPTITKADLAPLYEPWTLLPPEIRAMVEKRLCHNHFWEENCVPVVYTKNQDIKSGVNRLKALVGYEGEAKDTAGKLRRKNGVIAVTAQGEGTIKLVSIVEMAKRAIKPATGREGESWYLYTSLCSRMLEVSQKKHQGDKNDGDGSKLDRDKMVGDSNGSRETEGIEGNARRVKVPVLTVWMSKRSIPELKARFGEQALEVGSTERSSG